MLTHNFTTIHSTDQVSLGQLSGLVAIPVAAAPGKALQRSKKRNFLIGAAVLLDPNADEQRAQFPTQACMLGCTSFLK